jgi:hypothetical protein
MTHTHTTEIDLSDIVTEAFFDVEVQKSPEELSVSASLSHITMNGAKIDLTLARAIFGNAGVEALEEDAVENFDVGQALADEAADAGDHEYHKRKDEEV